MPLSREVLAAACRQGEYELIWGIRPEDFVTAPEGGLPIVVNVVEELGADAYVYGTVGIAGAEQDIVVRVDGRRPPGKGDRLSFAAEPGHEHTFSTTTGERLV